MTRPAATSSLMVPPQMGFMGLAPDDDTGPIQLGVLGIPFSSHTRHHLVGTHLAPAAIRQQSQRLDKFYPAFSNADPFSQLRLADYGDISLDLGDSDAATARIQQVAAELLETSHSLLALGGDGCISLPLLRSLQHFYPELALLHFSASTASAALGDPSRPHANNSFSHIAAEQLLSPELAFHIGSRGPCTRVDANEHAASLGYQVISGDQLFEQGIENTLSRLHETLAERPVYVSWDMNFFDPAAAPGISNPQWGGPNSREALELLEGLAGLEFVGFDIHGLSPAYDPQGLGAHLAASVALIMLHLACYPLDE